jgi:integral membrane protein
MDAAFRRYRLMSFVTGTTLLLLFLHLALKSVDHSLWQATGLFERVDGIAHGVVLFPIYMVMSFQFVLKAKLPVTVLALMFFAGFVPGLAFVIEVLMAKRYYPQGIPRKQQMSPEVRSDPEAIWEDARRNGTPPPQR